MLVGPQDPCDSCRSFFDVRYSHSNDRCHFRCNVLGSDALTEQSPGYSCSC